MADTLLILHVKGTQQETTTLPKNVVRAAISKGEITHSQLIWSPPDNAWKQVREMPHLLPSQKLAPAPQLQTGAVPRITAEGTKPKVKVSARVAVARTARPGGKSAILVNSTGELEVEEDDHFHPVKWLCGILAVIILVALAGNYLLVDRPLTSQLSQTRYSETTVIGHLGAFMQPNVLVIHVPSSSTLTDKNFTDFLVALAHSTPSAPFSSNLYERVVLTPGYMGRYSLSGYAWKQLGEMGQDDVAQRKEFILDQLANVSGEPVVSGVSNLSDDAQQALRDKMWQAFESQFVPQN
ncbi:MAG: hypothetical protein LV479_11125 [Methylacidiphilales bacterium]|nr:hypothetical protein [Candidatus Methylacidiphilales bacterium]